MADSAFQPIRRKKPASKTAPAQTRSKRGMEISIGALVVMTGLGIGTYFLVAGALGWHRDVALVAAGLVAGICSGGVLWPLWRSLRMNLSRWINPAKTPR